MDPDFHRDDDVVRINPLIEQSLKLHTTLDSEDNKETRMKQAILIADALEWRQKMSCIVEQSRYLTSL